MFLLRSSDSENLPADSDRAAPLDRMLTPTSRSLTRSEVGSFTFLVSSPDSSIELGVEQQQTPTCIKFTASGKDRRGQNWFVKGK